ncbi:transcriptional regulator [Actinophytocola glycyrrhizae]|uniref:Transcriptional regulator n=1 Tax=Actinophytocola glycyrrhizae TaxID=2044873 RepID=A0ABV9SG11_9PSEU
MFLADGGGGGRVTPTPTFTGTQTLHIEPSAIPEALKAFTDAYDRVSRKVRDLAALPIHKWAGDPVSGETAEQFAERTNAGGAESAYACLTGYQKQLKAAIDSLTSAQEDYLRTEGTNTALWGKYDQA